MQLVGREHSEPARLGAAVLVGVLVGLTPFYGLHLLICIALAALLRLNKILVYAAANISIPPCIPFIAVGCVQVGYIAVHGHALSLDRYSIEQLRLAFFYYWLAGALINGVVIGGVAGAVVWAVARARQKASASAARSAASDPLERLHAAFVPEGRMTAGIMRGKAAHDVVYQAVLAEAATADSLLDIGGGYGTLALLFALARPTARVRVSDWDAAKLELGRRVAARLGVPVVYERADAFQATPLGEPAACVTCIDLLHYADLAAQRALVDRLARQLAPGGRLIIRDMDADRRGRTRLTVLQERLSLLARRTLASRIVPRSGRDLAAQLRACGLTVEQRACHGWTPFSNTLWIARKER